MMDWDKVLTLLHIAASANDFPKLHGLRNAALTELEAMMVKAESDPADASGSSAIDPDSFRRI